MASSRPDTAPDTKSVDSGVRITLTKCKHDQGRPTGEMKESRKLPFYPHGQAEGRREPRLGSTRNFAWIWIWIWRQQQNYFSSWRGRWGGNPKRTTTCCRVEKANQHSHTQDLQHFMPFPPCFSLLPFPPCSYPQIEID